MSKAKHTQGRWMVSGMRTTSPAYKGHAVGPDGDPVVIVPYNDNDHLECLANARLIAAAPDMLEALQGIEHFSDALAFRTDPLSLSLRGWIDAGRKALAKAEGRA